MSASHAPRVPAQDQVEAACKICRYAITIGQPRVWIMTRLVTGLVHVACQSDVDGADNPSSMKGFDHDG